MPQTEHLILRELLAREGGWVSGAALARRLGLSRVGVWQRMERLRAAGFTLEARRARGYRLVRAPERLHPALVETLLRGRPRAFSLVILDEVDSTNDEVLRQLAAGRPTPFAVLARRQTQGRGRFGRSWHSASPANLYASFGFRPRIPPGRMPLFTLWMGVNLCELLANFVPEAPRLKWPNDLVYGSHKAGGMLTEARIDADQIRDLVFGVGLNVNAPSETWPTDLARRVISLSQVAGSRLDLNRLAAALIGRVLLAYAAFVEDRHREGFAERWHRYDLLRGRPVALLEGGRRHHGTVVGVDEEGALLLRDASARLHRFRAGEVTVEREP